MVRAYNIEGRLATNVPGLGFQDLRVVAYSLSGSNFGEILDYRPVDATGRFLLIFEGPDIPRDAYVMAIPANISINTLLRVLIKYPEFSISRGHISSSSWNLSQGIFQVWISAFIGQIEWKTWNWLREGFTVNGRVMKKVGDVLLPIENAIVQAYDLENPSGQKEGVGSGLTDKSGHFRINFRRIDFFVDRPMMVSSLQLAKDWPDLFFYGYQTIGNRTTEIYSESGRSARDKSLWDVPNRNLDVILVAWRGITSEDPIDPLPYGINFKFHGIGAIQAHLIQGGYASTGPNDALKNIKDSPFGSTLHIKGQFEMNGPQIPKFYQVLYAKWNGETSPTDDATKSDYTFKPILNESWVVSKYDPVKGNFLPFMVEPETIGMIPNQKVYQIPDYSDTTLTEKTRLVSWTTDREDTDVPRYPDGKYDLLLKAWDANGMPVALNPGHPELNRLTVVVDNTWPKPLLKKLGNSEIQHIENTTFVPECPVFSKSLGKLTVSFEASDKHFRDYTISFITGHGKYIDTRSKNYNSSPGGFSEDKFDWDIGATKVVKCAYQIRLSMWDRTTNGYGYIHYAEDTIHISIEP